MLINPLAGMRRHDLIQTLREAETKGRNLSGFQTASVLHAKYLQWVVDTERQLRNVISSADLDRLIRTPRFWALHGVNFAGIDSATAFDLVRVEVEEAVTNLGEACQALEFLDTRWPNRDAIFVVCDTTFYCTYPSKLEDADLASAFGLTNHDIHLLFPPVVVKELDRHKESRNQHLRFHGGYTLAVLADRVDQGNETGILHKPRLSAGIPETRRGLVTVEALVDPLHHVPLDDDDAEIVSSALTVSRLASQRLIFVTYDTHQALQARTEGLKTLHLTRPVENEPDADMGPPQQSRGKRG
ncbi:PIN domain-containing protein [Actinocorallia sp. API 0066]|uniref:PIN domain-containing protein n=1 Tax=Actinocorallia sp. API 0066 TaxID=2896846 RepID=UPI001E302CBD|nr:PIN domain-containing protein [Actinocorallia sp. API 0066]MCD0450419.1 PIN domain-containing protein [Actinocorallia sp. API 0066]